MIPPGWKLVPVTPTEAMIDAAMEAVSMGELRQQKLWQAMLTAAPPAPGAERAATLADGQDLPGQEGAMLRLLARCDFEEVTNWVKSEIVRGTGPSDRFEVIAATAANILVLTVLSVKERHTRALAQVLNRVAERAHQQLGAILARAPPNLLHAESHLRIVVDGENDGRRKD